MTEDKHKNKEKMKLGGRDGKRQERNGTQYTFKQQHNYKPLRHQSLYLVNQCGGMYDKRKMEGVVKG